MKTIDAFAFRDFDPTRILQRPYFREFGFANDTDEKILSDLAVTDSDDVPTLEKKNQRLAKIHNRLLDFHDLIARHVDEQLSPYRRVLSKKLDVNNGSEIILFHAKQARGRTLDEFVAENITLSGKINRVQTLSTFYVMTASMALKDLILSIKKPLKDLEQKLQASYRRQFGERLKQARERARLTRADLGDKLNITASGYRRYEAGERDVNLVTLILLARTLKVSSDWLIGLE